MYIRGVFSVEVYAGIFFFSLLVAGIVVYRARCVRVLASTAGSLYANTYSWIAFKALNAVRPR